MSYGSLPADPSVGASAGWRVGESIGGPSDEEMQQLMSSVVTRFESHVPFPGVGQRAEVYEALPRRFGYVRQGDNALFWQASQLDVDGFGRSGNVYTHLILDREPDSSLPRHRPVALWRSEQLRSPHQYALVSEASLGIDIPAPGPVVTREKVLAFLFDSAQWRVGMLGVLADAVFAALDGGPPVVLRCDDQSEAALWIAAASFLLSLRDARRLGFSLYERGASEHGSGVEQAFERGVHIAVVPRQDLLAVKRLVVEIDPALEVSIGKPGGTHSIAGGAGVDVRSASMVITMCMFTSADAAALFDAVESIGERISDAATVDPAWSLAMAALLLEDQYPDAAVLARQVLIGSTPAAVSRDAGLRAIAVRVHSQSVSDDPAVLWNEVCATPPETFSYELVASNYVARAVLDTRWLSGSAPAPLPRLPQRIENFVGSAIAALNLALEQPDGSGASVGRLRLIGFIARVLSSREIDPRVESRLEDVVAREIARLVADPRAPSVMATSGPFDDATLERWVVPELNRREPVNAHTIFATPPDVLRGLFGTSALLTPGAREPWSALQADAAALDAASRFDERLVADVAAHLLRRYGTWAAIPRDGLEIMRSAAARWTGRSLLAATAGDLSRVPVHVCVRVILASSPEEASAVVQEPLIDPALRQLAQGVGYARWVESPAAGETVGPLALLPPLEEHNLLVFLLDRVIYLQARSDDLLRAFGPAIVALSIAGSSDPALRAVIAERAVTIVGVVREVGVDTVLTSRVVPYLIERAREDADRASDFLLSVATTAALANEEGFVLSREQLAFSNLRDGGGVRIVDVVASLGLREGRRTFTIDQLADALASRAYIESSRAGKVAKQWWRAHGPRGERNVVDHGAEFLGGLFRSRQKRED